MAGYSGGRIKRIKIQKFMTYDDVEIYPKKGLNLVVGLNGSGKSSIMCAICLGLAGKPNFTGRATQLSDFIKHGHHEADIEIELECTNRKNVVIHRKLKKDKCEWTLNNLPSNQNEVASAVKKFNIDTSNLCQFLPQEKVVEFSRMDKKQRLENMLQAIGEPRLFQLFEELKRLYKEVTELEQTVKKHHNNKCAAEEQNEKISDEVQKQEGRVRLKKQLDDLEKQKKIVIYQDICVDVQCLKREAKELKAEIQLLSNEKNEATSQEDSIFNSYQNCYKQFQNLESHKKTVKTKMSNKIDALTNFKEQVENVKIEYRNRIKEKEDQRKRLLDLNKQIEGIHRTLTEELLHKAEYDEQERLKSQALAELQSEINDLSERMEKLSAEKNHIDYLLMNCRTELSSLQNEQNKKMANIKRVCKYTYQAACWLQENRHQFRSNVFLPIMFEINVNSQSNSKYIENTIAFRDMIAFVCEDKGDCERLTDILKKQQKLPVNIVMAPDTPMSNYKSPILSPQHKQCGLECFIIDLFTAPEPIMKYLCACCGIHRIPVTPRVVSGNMVEFISQSYPTFFSENMMFYTVQDPFLGPMVALDDGFQVTGKKSRYGKKNFSVRKDFIANKNLLLNTNDELQREVERKCQHYEELLKGQKQKLEVLSAHFSEKEKIQEKLRQEKKKFQDLKKNIENLQLSYLQRKKYQKQLQPDSNEEEDKERMTKKIISINELRERVLNDLNGLSRDFTVTEKEIVKMIMCMNTYSKNLKLARSANEEIHEKVKAVETKFENVNKEYREKKNYGQQLLEEIRLMGVEDEEMEATVELLLENFSTNSDDELEEEYIKYIEGRSNVSNVGLNMDEIEQRMNHIQAELNLNEDNEPLVNEYNTRKRKIEAIQLKIQDFQDAVKKLKQTIQEKKKEWLQPLQFHIKNINKKFSHYFKELNCVGEISLDIPDNPDDFVSYGLRINLKFHDEEASLCELSQTRHSGGECSVAAIVFILSLQELTEVPFRCIDEINQGMDSVNERKIYQLIYDSVADDRCSQYFLLTPKLLMDLDYPEDVAVHVIFNSPFLQLKLDVVKHLEIAQTV